MTLPGSARGKVLTFWENQRQVVLALPGAARRPHRSRSVARTARGRGPHGARDAQGQALAVGVAAVRLTVVSDERRRSARTAAASRWRGRPRFSWTRTRSRRRAHLARVVRAILRAWTARLPSPSATLRKSSAAPRTRFAPSFATTSCRPSPAGFDRASSLAIGWTTTSAGSGAVVPSRPDPFPSRRQTRRLRARVDLRLVGGWIRRRGGMRQVWVRQMRMRHVGMREVRVVDRIGVDEFDRGQVGLADLQEGHEADDDARGRCSSWRRCRGSVPGCPSARGSHRSRHREGES